MSIDRKTPQQLKLMRKAGLVVAEGLAAMIDAARVGITTAEIDAVGRDVLEQRGAVSSFFGYGGDYGPPFPAVACISVNDTLLHGIPDARPLADGDVVSIDFGAIVDGWHGDAARTIIVGNGESADAAMIAVSEQSFWAGASAMRPGNKVADVSRAIETAIRRAPESYGILREYTGHGIGTEMHMEPDVPNWHRSLARTPRLDPGVTLAIEPMITRGTRRTVVADDEWSVLSADGSRGSHWENTVAITASGVWVLTEPDGGEARLRALGVPFGALSD
ncbi:type I methionyl aminopeptidase [Tessaracoccus caeni]|uniref:type I methionyl aminopeptidase n=1 Tax=Tessaracoccus caeni TaxID=3031239 RepID=UPI0023DC73DC|nr:type I methionyl aminopeptidase [Tessaracoccus caeni]MDF1486960.1 type I methionyl aminopeptidase [Tessaracoccus caeni]